MGIDLGPTSYGKAGNHLFKVIRAGDRHEVRDYRVDVALEGDYRALHVEGDNRQVLATDTIRNAVYALARKHAFDAPEELGLVLVGYLLTQPLVRRATVRLSEQRWDRIVVDGRPHPHAFTRAAGGLHTATVGGEGHRRTVTAGIDGLELLKTTDSGWANFLEGGYRTLPDTDDRILATSVTAAWDYRELPGGYGDLWEGVHRQLAATFTDHFSPSVQHTAWRMGKAVLERFDEIQRITLVLPNRHHLLYDLSPFGLDNDREVYWVSVEPYGRIEATVERD